MRDYDEMNAQERTDFLELVATVLKEMRAETAVERKARPALIALWVTGHGRPTRNVWTQFDIDRESFIDEAVGQGVLFMRNLLKVMDKHPPPPDRLGDGSVAEMRTMANEVIRLLANRHYREVVEFTFTDFFRQAREQGRL